MRFKDYIQRTLICKGTMFVGFLAVAYGTFSFIFGNPLGAVIGLIGLFLTGYGTYKLDEFKFVREEKRKIYHMQGHFR